MPRIADSLERAGYLKPLGDKISQLLKKSQDDQKQDEFNSLMQTAMDSLRKTYSTQPEDNITWNSDAPIPMPKTTLGKGLIPPQSDKMDMSDDPGNITGVNVKPKAPGINIEEPDFQILGDVGGRKYGDTKDQQRMKQDQILADFIQKAGNIKGLDQAALSNGLKALQLQGSAYTPAEVTNEYKQFDDTKSLYRINSMGDIELVRPGTDKESIKNLGSYVGKDGYNYMRIVGNDGVIKEVKSENPVRPLKGTTINIPAPKSEKWKDFGAYVNTIDYKEDPDTGKIVPNTPEERKVARDIAKNRAIGTMLPRAVNWYNTEIKQKWGAENISPVDFLTEVEESFANGELSDDEAQDLIDFNNYRPFLFDVMRETARKVEGGDQ